MNVIPQLVWRWKIAAYLFLAGAGAGAYLLGVIAMFGGYDAPAKLAITVGIPVVAFSTLFLIADLGRPEKFFTAVLHPSTSWISRGFFILSAEIIVGAIHIAFWVWPFNSLSASPDLRAGIAVIGAIFAVATALYTGILIGVIISRPFWNSPLLPVLFLTSAISTGVGLILFFVPIWFGLIAGGANSTLAAFVKDMARADMILIILEALIVYLYLQIVADRAPEGVALLTKGKFSGVFWGGFVVVGLLIPLVVEYFSLLLTDINAEMLAGFLAGVLVLFGGLLLRFLILSAGVRAPLYVRVPFRVRPGQ